MNSKAESFTLDPLSAKRAIDHMNDDHADALLRYAHHFGKRTDAKTARMTSLNEVGFSIEITTEYSQVELQIPFKAPLTCEKDAHTMLVSMAVEARKALSD